MSGTKRLHSEDRAREAFCKTPDAFKSSGRKSQQMMDLSTMMGAKLRSHRGSNDAGNPSEVKNPVTVNLETESAVSKEPLLTNSNS